MADLALYMSKTAGRNRATCFMRLPEESDPARVLGDLAGAAAAGNAELHVVPGPE